MFYSPSNNNIITINPMHPFTDDASRLQKGLFLLSKARQGAQTVLNINYLPDLLHMVKSHLSSDETLRLEEYHLQNYLI